MKRPRRIISGAQTGVDRAALDVALELGIRCGGWVPKGRLDEEGRIPERYPGLEETTTADWNERTEANVRGSDGTLILSRGRLAGGSAYTAEVATRLGRPCLHLDLATQSRPEAARAARKWIDARGIDTLNVAGPRASKDPEMYEIARRLLLEVMAGSGPAPAGRGTS